MSGSGRHVRDNVDRARRCDCADSSLCHITLPSFTARHSSLVTASRAWARRAFNLCSATRAQNRTIHRPSNRSASGSSDMRGYALLSVVSVVLLSSCAAVVPGHMYSRWDARTPWTIEEGTVVEVNSAQHRRLRFRDRCFWRWVHRWLARERRRYGRRYQHRAGGRSRRWRHRR